MFFEKFEVKTFNKIINKMFKLVRNSTNIYSKLYALRNLRTSKILKNKTYTQDKDWLLNCGNHYKIGLSEEASKELGELVYIEFINNNNDIINKDEELVIIESIKAAAEIKAPFDCIIDEQNIKLEENIDIVNDNPECENNSWILKIKKK